MKDRQAQVRINARILRIQQSGHFGDMKPVRDGVSEIRIDYGPGYRIYFLQRGSVLVVLLTGGDKSTQDTGIRTATKIAREWKD